MTDDTYELSGRVLRTVPQKKKTRASLDSSYRGFNANQDTELIVGSIFGLRGWAQDKLGRLTPVSISKDVPFTPGVNVAKCYFSHDDGDIRNHNMFNCTCGYYGYFSDATSESTHGSIGGIIEATGVAVVGTQGFRAEKAELKALIVRPGKKGKVAIAQPSKPVGTRPMRWLLKWFLPSFNRIATHRRLDRAGNPFNGGYAFAILGPSILATMALSILGVIFGSVFMGMLSLLGVLGLFVGLKFVAIGDAVVWPERTKSANLFHSYLRGGLYEVRLKLPGKPKPIVKRDEGSPDDPFSVARLRVLYPGVPIFYSLADATREFPLTKVSEFQRPDPPLPSPLNTDNFWSL